jgi:hypothetical protein
VDYICKKCGAKDCKLWRQYSTFLSHIELLCADCAVKDQKIPKEFSVLDARGHRPSDISGTTDQIGWLVPAVPDGEGSFWGYSSVPQDRVDWWRKLPTYPEKR